MNSSIAAKTAGPGQALDEPGTAGVLKCCSLLVMTWGRDLPLPPSASLLHVCKTERIGQRRWSTKRFFHFLLTQHFTSRPLLSFPCPSPLVFSGSSLLSCPNNGHPDCAGRLAQTDVFLKSDYCNSGVVQRSFRFNSRPRPLSGRCRVRCCLHGNAWGRFGAPSTLRPVEAAAASILFFGFPCDMFVSGSQR